MLDEKFFVSNQIYPHSIETFSRGITITMDLNRQVPSCSFFMFLIGSQIVNTIVASSSHYYSWSAGHRSNSPRTKCRTRSSAELTIGSTPVIGLTLTSPSQKASRKIGCSWTLTSCWFNNLTEVESFLGKVKVSRQTRSTLVFKRQYD